MMEKPAVRFIVALMIAVALAAPSGSQAVRAATGPLCYVDVDATVGTNNGDSWTNAYTSLQSALTDTNCDEIWVAEGLYVPTTDTTDRSISFIIPADVEVYGGFAATEAVRSGRDPGAHVTILSGDIDGDDADTDGNHIAESYLDIVDSNSYHVVYIDGTTTGVTETTVLDGFTITAGQADGAFPQSVGGGLLCNGHGASGECSPALDNLVFSGSRANGGGAVDIQANDGGRGNPAFTNVTFQGNHAIWGGAIYNAAYSTGSQSSPSFTNVTFSHNSSETRGGAIENDGRQGGTSSPVLTNVTFHGNDGGNSGGAMYNDGSMSGGNSSPILRNVSFSGNSASVAGGAIYNAGNDTGNSDPTLVNIILWGDSVDAGGSGAEIYNSTATPTISYSVVQGSGGSGAGWDTTLGTDGGNNLDAEPMLGPLADNGGSTDTMELIWGSSANDTGDDATCTAAPVSGVDQRGVPRPVGPHCDIGALERVPPEIRADFDSDGLAEIGYFRAASGLWALLESSEGFSYAMPRYYSWGQTGDILALGDYDGDGRMDPTVRRPPESGQSAAYRILLSTTDYDFGSSLTVPAGWPGIGDTPVPGDYNRDGVTDPAIWRGSAGVWIIPLSPGFTTYAFLSWGITGDTPVGADVDGDGQADIGYWRPSTGVWGFLKSTQGYSYSSPLYFSWGQSGDIPVMADYDGDHKADPAVVIPPAGGQSRAYRILLSTMSYSPGSSLTIPAGWPGLNDTPVPADYDGDRKADAAIWRGNTGVWIIPKSSTNNTSYMFAAWGATGDVPAR